MRKVIKDFVIDFKKEVKSIKKNGFKKQIPNLLTFSRALAPFVIIPTILTNNLGLAIIELIIFALTDFLDGKVARKYDCVSEFGIKLDAVCDKIFVIGIVIPAIVKFPILVINLVFELAISYVNLISESKNNNPRSIMTGKIKTTFLSVTLILSYIPNVAIESLLGASLVTWLFQIIALIKYKQIDDLKDMKKK